MIVTITNLHRAVGIFAVADNCLQQPSRLMPPHCTRGKGFDQASKPAFILCCVLTWIMVLIIWRVIHGRGTQLHHQCGLKKLLSLTMWITKSLPALWRFLMVYRETCSWLTCHIQEFSKFNFWHEVVLSQIKMSNIKFLLWTSTKVRWYRCL